MARSVPAALVSVAVTGALLGASLLASPALARDKAAVARFQREYGSALQSGDASAAAAAVRALAEANDVDAAKVILKAVFGGTDVGYEVTDAAFAGLESITDAKARDLVAKEAKRAKGATAVIACRILGAYGGHEGARSTLLGVVAKGKDDAVVAAALGALARHRPDLGAVDLVIARMKKVGRGRIVAEGRRVLEAWTGATGIWEPADWESWWAGRREGFDFDAARAAADQGDRDGGDDAPEDRGGRRVSTRPESPIFGTVESEKVVFVVDISGSMQVGVAREDMKPISRLDYVKSELVTVIEEQLSDAAIFNIIIFDDKIGVWKAELVRSTDKNRAAASKFVRKLAPRGGTNTAGALEAAFASSGADTIVFLSDGTPTDGKPVDVDEILGSVRKWNAGRNIRLDAICFLAGDKMDARAAKVVEFPELAKEFMQKLAEENGGTYRLID